MQLDATTEQHFTDGEGNILTRWVLSMCLLRLSAVLKMIAHTLQCRQFVYCNDLPGLLAAMELLEGETSEDYFEVVVIIIFIFIIIIFIIFMIIIFMIILITIMFSYQNPALQVVGYDDGRGVLKCSLNRVKKGQVHLLWLHILLQTHPDRSHNLTSRDQAKNFDFLHLM